MEKGQHEFEEREIDENLVLVEREFTDSDDQGENEDTKGWQKELSISIDCEWYPTKFQLRLPLPKEKVSNTIKTDLEDDVEREDKEAGREDEEGNLSASGRAEEVSSSSNSEDSWSDVDSDLDDDSIENEVVKTSLIGMPIMYCKESGCIEEVVRKTTKLSFPWFDGPNTGIVQAMRDEYIRRSFYKDPGLFFSATQVVHAIDLLYGVGTADRFLKNARRYSFPILELLEKHCSDSLTYETTGRLNKGQILEEALINFPLLVGEEKLFSAIESENKRKESREFGAFSVSFPGGKIKKGGNIFIAAEEADITIFCIFAAYTLLGIEYPTKRLKSFVLIEELFFDSNSEHEDISNKIQNIVKFCKSKRKN